MFRDKFTTCTLFAIGANQSIGITMDAWTLLTIPPVPAKCATLPFAIHIAFAVVGLCGAIWVVAVVNVAVNRLRVSMGAVAFSHFLFLGSM